MSSIAAESSVDLRQDPPTVEENVTDQQPQNSLAVVPTGQLTVAVTPSSAFQILNQDHLGQIAKPNAIVRPVRRAEPNSGQKTAEDTVIKKPPEPDNFAKELDLRLRKLRIEKKLQKTSLLKNASKQDSLDKRPLFITTVPTGVFLQPVKEPPVVPSKRVYAYSSRPRIFTNRNAGAVKDKGQIGRVDREITTAINGIRAFTHFLSSTANKPRETQGGEPYKNVMHERRIVRGSNFSQTHLISAWNPYFAYAGLLSGKGDGDCGGTREAEAKRRQVLRKRCITRNQRNIIGTPPPLPGRRHEDVQTEKYLEELFERPPEIDVNIQTDLFLQRPPSPPYVIAKTGVDACTEILEGELFDFDLEVQPILETLIGATAEQSLIEVLHEEEIADLKQQQQEFLAIREAEYTDFKRLQAEEERIQAEKERRQRQEEISKELDAHMQERVTAAKLLQGHIANLLPDILNSLEPLSDEAQRESLEQQLCPWLTKEVSEEVGRIVDSREILIEIIKEIIKQRAAIYAGFIEEEEEDKGRYSYEEEGVGEEENLEEGEEEKVEE